MDKKDLIELVIKPIEAKGRVELELAELREKNEKLASLIGKIKSDNWESH